MVLPGRSYSSGNSYRYGFNGKENDNEVKGTGNQYDYGFRIYDPRIGRFLSVDPLDKDYPWYTPYQFAGNKPTRFIDLDGAEEHDPMMWEDEQYLSGKMSYETLRERRQARGIGTLIAGAIVADIYFFKGKATQTVFQLYTYTQLANSFEHNRASTPEARIEQNKRTRNALADAFITWGTGKMFGMFTSASAEVFKLAGNRFNFAKNFYKAAGYSEANAVEHIRGIELTEKVFETTLKKGTEVEQWLRVDKATGELIPGNYYTLPGADPAKLGINLEGRVRVKSVLNEDTKFLQSTAADISDTWTTPGKTVEVKGGETQLFQTKVNATPIKE